MEHLVSSISKYLSVFGLYIKMGYLRMMEYRVDMITHFVASCAYMVGYLSFIGVILSRVQTVAGWNFDQMLTMFAVSQIVVYLSWSLFHYSLSQFSDLIRNGDLDMALKTPINARFIISFKEQGLELPLSLVVAIVTLLYAMRNMTWQWENLGLFIIFLVCGLVILYSLTSGLAAFSFWLVEGEDLVNLFVWDILDFGRYPISVFPPVIAVILTTIIPVLLITYVPVTAILGMLDWRLGLLSLMMVLVTFVVSEKIWQMGLRHYSSASS